MYIFLTIFILIIIFGILLVLKFSKKKKLTPDKKNFFITQLKRIIANGSYKEQVIDIDKLYHKILLEIGYIGNFGEILKQEPKEIGDLNKIWELHKLRNKLVHDFDLLSEKILKEKADNYISEIKSLLNKI